MSEPKEWCLVVFAHQCYTENWDDNREFIICPICNDKYADCPCVGPAQEGIITKKLTGNYTQKP